MRSFMRAIGLGGLFKSSSRHSGKSHRRANGGPAMGGLVPVEDITLVLPDARASSSVLGESRRRASSAYERPQFLFFCGSDNADISVTRGFKNTTTSNTTNTIGQDFAFGSGELQARASYRTSPTATAKIPAPMISHRIPVFFTPQHAMMGNFE